MTVTYAVIMPQKVYDDIEKKCSVICGESHDQCLPGPRDDCDCESNEEKCDCEPDELETNYQITPSLVKNKILLSFFLPQKAIDHNCVKIIRDCYEEAKKSDEKDVIQKGWNLFKTINGTDPEILPKLLQGKLEEALGKVVDGTLFIREATRQFGIPFGTLYNRFEGIHGNNPGRPTIFTHDEELAILKSAAKCADWGFPLSLLDMRIMAKYYSDGKGTTVHVFKNNLPGIDWTYSLLQRHKKSHGQRISTNIERARASVSRKTLGKFYDNLENILRGSPSSNIFNYDESNLSDDLGKKRRIYRQGVKYPEEVMNHSKGCTTIMVCGAADGTLLSPYVIYRSVHLYDSWRENGPRGPPCCNKPCCSLGTRYNRTISGWMDGVTFRDWFTTLFLPHAKRLKGRKALIGDNLSSHLDDNVLKMCVENDIDFICLVPNSTHICQPSDVGFFRPMEGAWRETLTDFKLQICV
ncbi:hypothetical protein JTB14_017859 [Gonioctena quinquepunctata]|nr:hypothetical protein JTB14_017859 [Gonioctena quinquepunctata]